MSLFVDASQEETFRSLMDYFTGKRTRILTSNSPSYIRAEIGSWVSMSMSKAKGEVEANITKRDSGSYVNLNFTFLKEHVANMIVGVIGSLILFVFGLWIMNVVSSGYASALPPWSREEFFSMVSSIYLPIIVLLAVGCFVVIMAVSGYNTSRTRKRFIEEFNMFMQSLASRKE